MVPRGRKNERCNERHDEVPSKKFSADWTCCLAYSSFCALPPKDMALLYGFYVADDKFIEA